MFLGPRKHSMTAACMCRTNPDFNDVCQGCDAEFSDIRDVDHYPYSNCSKEFHAHIQERKPSTKWCRIFYSLCQGFHSARREHFKIVIFTRPASQWGYRIKSVASLIWVEQCPLLTVFIYLYKTDGDSDECGWNDEGNGEYNLEFV